MSDHPPLSNGHDFGADEIRQHGQRLIALELNVQRTANMILTAQREASDDRAEFNRTIAAFKTSFSNLEGEFKKIVQWHRHPNIRALGYLVGTAVTVYLSVRAAVHP